MVRSTEYHSARNSPAFPSRLRLLAQHGRSHFSEATTEEGTASPSPTLRPAGLPHLEKYCKARYLILSTLPATLTLLYERKVGPIPLSRDTTNCLLHCTLHASHRLIFTLPYFIVFFQSVPCSGLSTIYSLPPECSRLCRL